MNDKKLPECPEEGRLPVDLYETDDEIVLRTVIAGVEQSEIDISINNDMVTIRGERKEPEIVAIDDYIKHECY
jgi:HSP20 family molecular chaperone IbpA